TSGGTRSVPARAARGRARALVTADSTCGLLRSAVSSAPEASGHRGEQLPSGSGDIAGQLLRPPGKAGLIAGGYLEAPVAHLYPLAQVREACTELERRHTHGEIAGTR
ncbi:MAG TPA: hypothetical protein VHV09_00275, partial [Trebonia sp.]|nr:hypothetical protein [Trebonia sp.]